MIPYPNILRVGAFSAVTGVQSAGVYTWPSDNGNKIALGYRYHVGNNQIQDFHCCYLILGLQGALRAKTLVTIGQLRSVPNP